MSAFKFPLIFSKKKFRSSIGTVSIYFQARLGWRYCSKMGLHIEKEQFIRLLINAAWARKLGLNGIELALIANGSPEHLSILGIIITNIQIFGITTLSSSRNFKDF